MQASYCPYCMHQVQTNTCPHCGKDIGYPGNPMHLPVGYTLNGNHSYILGAALGQGGFGITYIAMDAVTGIRVAVKEYFPTYCSGRSNGSSVHSYLGQEEIFYKGKEQFLLEAQTLKRLSDLDCIVNVLDYFQTNNTAYLVMEYLEGRSLKDHVLQNGRMPAQQFLERIQPLMEDMERMHQRGVIHRDIAPDNIILQPDGTMKLIDFGAARCYLGDKSMTVVVKKGFAPVEQYLSKGCGTYTDVYALAATIYYCITGQVPMDSAERQYCESNIPSPREYGAMLSPGQENALAHALAIQPKNRTQKIRRLAEELGSKSVSEPIGLFTGILKAFITASTQKWFLPAVGATLALLLILSAGLIKQDRAPSGEPVSNTALQAQETETIAVTEETLQDVFPTGNGNWKDNILMVDACVLDTNDYKNHFSQNYEFLNSGYKREEITAVTFLDHLETLPDSYWDVSENHDGSVLAWAETGNNQVHIYIAANGGINGSVACKRLLTGCRNLTRICFNNALHTEEATDMAEMFYDCSSLTELDLSSFDTSSVTNMNAIFYSCDNLTDLNISSFETSNVTDMSSMFQYCRSITTLDFDHFDTSSVENMKSMFESCDKLNQLDISGFDTSSVTNMSNMFSFCGNLSQLDVSSFDTSNVEDMSGMFKYSESLTELDVSKFDTSSVTDMSGMFEGCSSITSFDLSNFDTSSVTDMSHMFAGCSSITSLDLINFDTSAVTTMVSMFSECLYLSTVDLNSFDTSSVTNMAGMFSSCKALKTINLCYFDTSKVESMSLMFCGSFNLQKVEGIQNWNTNSLKDVSLMFLECTSLQNLNLNWNISKIKAEETYYVFMEQGKTINGKPWENYFK